MSALCTDLQDGDLWNKAELKTERDKMVDRDRHRRVKAVER